MNTGYNINASKNRTPACRSWSRSVHACRKLANRLHVKVSLRLAHETRGSLPAPMVRQAVTEAEALAWSTPYPLLFLPDLAEEKVRDARQWVRRQHEILERQKALAAVL